MTENKAKISENIGIAQINSIAGDLKSNSLKIIEYIKKANELGLDILIFPELSLTGHPLGNVLERYPFLVDESKKWLYEIAKLTKNTAVIISFTDEDSKTSIAILRNGSIEKFVQNNELCEINNKKYLIISEQVFSSNNLKKYPKADVIINISSCPSRTGAEYLKNTTLSAAASESNTPIIYVNRVGAVDNLSFDGLSRMYDNKGCLISRAKAFEEQLLVINKKEISPLPNGMDKPIDTFFSADYESDLERTYKTIIQGIKDYFTKCGLKRAVLGLSGGLDSTVCAVLLADALGKENVIGISMPSKITSSESKNDAKELAKNIGIAFFELPIKTVVDTASEAMNILFTEMETPWPDRYKTSYTKDNIQARSRATYLWCVSNEFPSCIPIATSDKSEAYMGYATINGDMTGGFAPIADVTKTKLFALARWLNKNREVKNCIPESVILKKPGAELAINPKTGKTLCAEEALMPYEFLDEIIWRIENKNETYDDLLNSKFLYEEKFSISQEQKTEWINKFYSRMSKALYKWSIVPPSVIVDSHSINKSEYYQPVTSGRIEYKPLSKKEISDIIKSKNH